jgi:hypothetical protein
MRKSKSTLGFQIPESLQVATELVLPAWVLKTQTLANHFGYLGSRTELIHFQQLTCLLDGFRLGQDALDLRLYEFLRSILKNHKRLVC